MKPLFRKKNTTDTQTTRTNKTAITIDDKDHIILDLKIIKNKNIRGLMVEKVNECMKIK